MVPGRIVPVAPEALIRNRRQVDTAAALKLGAAVLAAAGIETCVVHRIVGAQSVDICISDQLPYIAAVAIQHISIVEDYPTIRNISEVLTLLDNTPT